MHTKFNWYENNEYDIDLNMIKEVWLRDVPLLLTLPL